MSPPNIVVPGVERTVTGPWRAWCRCAWSGELRDRFSDAQDDLNAHFDNCQEPQ